MDENIFTTGIFHAISVKPQSKALYSGSKVLGENSRNISVTRKIYCAFDSWHRSDSIQGTDYIANDYTVLSS